MNKHKAPFDVAHLPKLPGVYKFLNGAKEVIYVGKAKNIQKRVRSYFSGSHDVKTEQMLTHVCGVDYTVVNREYEALLLENNLIKALKPKYNILLKDQKKHPYLCVTDERFPRLLIVRTVDPTQGRYYGPFMNTRSIQQTLVVIKKLFTFRTCNYNLSKTNMAKRAFKVCLDYHLGNCGGPCQALQSQEQYNQEIAQIEALLKNNFSPFKKTFHQQMHEASDRQDYKLAQRNKEKLTLLEQYQAKSLVVHPRLGDLDVVAVVMDATHFFVGYFHIQQGSISFTQHRVFVKKLEEHAEDFIPLIACELRLGSGSKAKEVLVNLPIDLHMEEFQVKMPKMGDKYKLVELALANAFACKKDFLLNKTAKAPDSHLALVALQNNLQLPTLPNWIECFDNSNLQGHYPVSSMVCFKQGKPLKKEYRYYHIKTVVGANDCASIGEVVQRRYARLCKASSGLPDLIVIDGGRGQLNAAVTALKGLGIYEQISILAIAKRLEELYLPNQPPLLLDKRDPGLQLIQHARNEAHRFALAFHTKVRNKAAFHLEAIQ